ncbi:hypothetical protein GCM10023148_08050 [Actinokineospora soli]
MFTQDALSRELALRVAEAAAGPGQPVVAPGGPVDLDQLVAAVAEAPDTVAVVVLCKFDAAVFARSSLAFAAGLDPDAAARWFSAYTRTVFLVGNPANLTRFPFAHVSDDGTTGWLGPDPAARFLGLRRLLKLFTPAATPEPPAEIPLRVPGRGGGRRLVLEVATAGVSTGDYLVHLNHILAESVLTEELRPGDRLLLRHVPTVVGGPYLRLRVARDGERLRAYASLTSESTVETEPADERRSHRPAQPDAA